MNAVLWDGREGLVIEHCHNTDAAAAAAVVIVVVVVVVVVITIGLDNSRKNNTCMQKFWYL